MHLRRTLAVITTALALITLSSCGRDYATDEVSNVAHGVTDRDGSVDVLNAVIVSAEDGSGTFIASFANNEEEAATLESLQGSDPEQLTADEFTPVEIAADGLVNLATDGGLGVEGEFTAGDFVPLSLQFGDGERVELKVPVVTNCGDFAGLDGPADEAACEPEHDTEGH